MNGNKPAELEIVTKIPGELEQHRGALAASLFYLSLGEPPAADIPTEGCKSTRIKLTGKAIGYLEHLAPRFGSRRNTIINALAWAAAQSEQRRAMLKNTTI